MLLDYLREILPGRRKSLTIILSVVSRKDWGTMLQLLRDGLAEIFSETVGSGNCLPVRWIFTDSGNPKAVPPESLRAHFGMGEVCQNPEQAVLQAFEQQAVDGLILLTGSVFLIGRVRPFLLGSTEVFTSIAEKTGS